MANLTLRDCVILQTSPQIVSIIQMKFHHDEKMHLYFIYLNKITCKNANLRLFCFLRHQYFK